MTKQDIIISLIFLTVLFASIDFYRFHPVFHQEYMEMEEIDDISPRMKDKELNEYSIEFETEETEDTLEVKSIESTTVFVKIPESYFDRADRYEVYLLTPQGQVTYSATNLEKGYDGEYFRFFRFDDITNSEIGFYFFSGHTTTFQKTAISKGRCAVVFDQMAQFNHVTYF